MEKWDGRWGPRWSVCRLQAQLSRLHSLCSGTAASDPLLFSSCFSESSVLFGSLIPLPSVITQIPPAHPAPSPPSVFPLPHAACGHGGPLSFHLSLRDSQGSWLSAAPLLVPPPQGPQRPGRRSRRMRCHLEPSGQSLLKARPTFNSHRCYFRKTEASEGLSVARKTSLPEQIFRWPGPRQSGVRGGVSGPVPPRLSLLTGHDGVEALQLVERFTVQQLYLQKLNPGLGLLETQENDLFIHLPLPGAPRNQGPCLIPPAGLAGTRSARLLWGGFPPGMASLVVKTWTGV